MATSTRRYLVIANQTLAEAELSEAIRQRLEPAQARSTCSFPTPTTADLAARIARGAPIAPAAGDATVDALATEHAQHRLGQLLDDLRGMGVDVDGDLGDEDPIKAVDQLRERRQFDEIILSTLPQPISKWLGMDLPHRLHRHTGLPVTTITAKRVV